MIDSLTRFIAQSRQIFLSLVLLDGLMLCLHLLFGRSNGFFHLDLERNLPTFYQSLKLLVFGVIFLLLIWQKKLKKNNKKFLLPLSVFMIALGFDELFEIHENIYRIFDKIKWLQPSKIVDTSLKVGYRSSLWVLYYLPIIILVMLWGAYWFKRFKTTMKKNAKLIGASIFLLIGIIGAEVLGSSGLYSDQTYFWFVSIEETSEMLFATVLILIGCRVVERQVAEK